MFEKFQEYFDGKTFDTVEEFREDVRTLSSVLEDELGRAERWADEATPKIVSELGCEIKELYEDEDV